MPTPIFTLAPDEPPVTPHSIYRDIVNLPDPMKLGLTVAIYNYDDVTLYMRVDGYAAGWAFTSNDFGALASGANTVRNIDRFGSRAKPAAETTEFITVRLRAYTDAGYTVLKWTYERSIEVVMIKSDDGSWTQDFLNNFDDGTVQGWAVAAEVDNATNWPKIFVNTAFCLSPPYACVMEQANTSALGNMRARLYKSFNTPNRNRVYAIADIRMRKYINANLTLQWTRMNPGIYLAQGPVLDRWIRLVTPIPKNQSVEVQIVSDWYFTTNARYGWTYLDDFRIISKD